MMVTIEAVLSAGFINLPQKKFHFISRIIRKCTTSCQVRFYLCIECHLSISTIEEVGYAIFRPGKFIRIV